MMPKVMEEEILRELKRISTLLALNLTKELTQREQVEILDNAGFQPKEIAEILRTTPNTVSVTLAKSRKERRKNSKDSLEK